MDPIVLERGCARIVGAPRFEPQCFGRSTAREGRAAEGPTNREIAQALFVTQRTVEVHLTSIYRKLAISSRSQLAGALVEPARA